MTKLCTVYGTYVCFSSKENPSGGRGAHSHWNVGVPNSYHFDLRDGGNDQGCNRWASIKARNLQHVNLDVTSV